MPAFPRSIRALAVVAVAAFTLSCAGDTRPGPTQPSAARPSFATAGDPSIVPQVNALIDALFISLPRRQQAHQHFDQLVDAWRRGDSTGAANKVRILEDQTLDQLRAGQIADPDGGGPLTAVTGCIRLFNLINQYIGATAEIIDLDENTYIALVEPSATTQTFTSGLGATFIVPGGGTSQLALLYIQRQVDGGDLGSGLPPVSDPYEVHFIPDITFSYVQLALCAERHDLPAGSTRIAHKLDDGSFEILPPVFLGVFCEETQVGDATPALAPRGMLAMARGWARGALRAFGATPAYAGHAATGATLISLSPNQVVVTATRIAVTANGGTYGGSATIDATLTDVADTPLAGRTVSLTVDGVARGSAVTGAAGGASFSIAGLSAGAHTYVVAFAGEGYLEASTRSGSFTVAQASLVLTASSTSAIYGAPLPACTVTYAGLLAGDTKSAIGSVSTCSYAGLPLGTSSVLPTDIVPAPANYAVTKVPGTFTLTYLTTVGHTFISPLPMREIRRGSKVPLKFSLYQADGVTPVSTGVFRAWVTGGSPAATLGPLGTFTYKSGFWELTVDSGSWPLGVVTIWVPLGDGSQVSVQEVIK